MVAVQLLFPTFNDPQLHSPLGIDQAPFKHVAVTVPLQVPPHIPGVADELPDGVGAFNPVMAQPLSAVAVGDVQSLATHAPPA